MVDPDAIPDAMEKTLVEDPDVPDAATILTHEWDSESSEAWESPPVIELYYLGEPQRTGESGTRKIRDDSGGVIGRLVQIPFLADVQVDVATVAGSSYDARDLGTTVRRSLYRHDDARGAQAEPLRGEETAEFPDGEPLSPVSTFAVNMGEPSLDPETSSTMRRWTSTVEVQFSEEVNSVEEYGPVEYVKTVVWAKDGQMTAGEDPGSASYDPNDYWP